MLNLNASFWKPPAASFGIMRFWEGWLEHTLSLVELAERISEQYPELNRDLLIAGAFLHDIGKVFELSSEVSFDYSPPMVVCWDILFREPCFFEQKISQIAELSA